MNKNYRFICHIIDEDTDEVVIQGGTYILPESVSKIGACENVDMEVAKVLRNFSRKIEKLKETEEDRDIERQKEELSASNLK